VINVPQLAARKSPLRSMPLPAKLIGCAHLCAVEVQRQLTITSTSCSAADVAPSWVPHDSEYHRPDGVGVAAMAVALTRALSITQIPTLPRPPALSARSRARLPAPMPGTQCGCHALRIGVPYRPGAIWPIWSLEYLSSQMPGSGSGNCHREPLCGWVDPLFPLSRCFRRQQL
jgi:hypothetical protein